MNDPADSTIRYQRDGDWIIDTMNGDRINTVTGCKSKPGLTDVSKPDLFDAVPEPTTLAPAAPAHVLEELAKDINITEQSLQDFGAEQADDHDLANLCGCGECLLCVMAELAEDDSQANDEDEHPGEEELEDDPADFDLGGES